MAKFAALPKAGTEVVLANRTVVLPTAGMLEHIRNEAKPFYSYCSLCPIEGDVIMVDTRPGEKFWVESAGQTASYDRWICQVRQITAIDDAGVLAFGYYVQWTIKLPGVQGEIPSDVCMLSQVEIIGQAQTVQRLKAPL
jgi:hypothetical protein